MAKLVKLDAELTEQHKAELVALLGEGDFEWHELAEMLSAFASQRLRPFWPEQVRKRENEV
jgi:hypothetical protein